MIHGAKRKSKKYDADNSTHNRGKLTLVHCAASFSHPCPLRLLSSDEDTGGKLYIILIVIDASHFTLGFPEFLIIFQCWIPDDSRSKTKIEKI